MRTFQYGHVRIYYNADLSGNATIEVNDPNLVGGHLTVPCDALLRFIRKQMVNECIAKLEELL